MYLCAMPVPEKVYASGRTSGTQVEDEFCWNHQQLQLDSFANAEHLPFLLHLHIVKVFA